MKALPALFFVCFLFLVLPTHAQTPADPPVVAAPQIIDALTSKRIVLDQPGKVAQHAQKIDLQVQFDFDSARLHPQGKRQLDQLAQALQSQQLNMSAFQLAGHTDQSGGADYNLQLSLARAETVKNYLAQVHGIALARLQTLGFGFMHLLTPDAPHAAINRRVEVRRIAQQAFVK